MQEFWIRLIVSIAIAAIGMQNLFWPETTLKIRRWTRIAKYDPSNFLYEGPNALQFVRACGVGLMAMSLVMMWSTVASMP